MFEVKCKTPEIQERSELEENLVLTADMPKPETLFQAQKLKVKTGVAIKSDQLAIAVPTPENNELGLVFGTGFEALSTDGEEIELLVYNRNAPGQQRQIEIKPGMVLGYVYVVQRVKTAPMSTNSPAKKSPGRPKKEEKPEEAAA